MLATVSFCSRDRTCRLPAQPNINTLGPPVNSIPTMFKVINSGVCSKNDTIYFKIIWGSRSTFEDQQEFLQVKTSSLLKNWKVDPKRA